MTEGKANCSPALNMKSLTSAQRIILLGHLATPVEWEGLIQGITSGVLPEWLVIKEQPEKGAALVPEEEDEFQLLSPKGGLEKQGIFEIVPNWSFDSGISTESKTTVKRDDPLIQVKKLSQRFKMSGTLMIKSNCYIARWGKLRRF